MGCFGRGSPPEIGGMPPKGVGESKKGPFLGYCIKGVPPGGPPGGAPGGSQTFAGYFLPNGVKKWSIGPPRGGHFGGSRGGPNGPFWPKKGVPDPPTPQKRAKKGSKKAKNVTLKRDPPGRDPLIYWCPVGKCRTLGLT